MDLDFRGQKLQGRSFRGQKLAAVSFAGADIRSTDFSGADLTGADFRQAQAGLGRRWSLGYRIGALFIAVVVGVIIGSAGSIPAYIITEPPQSFSLGLWIPLAALAVLAVLTLLLLLLRRSLGASVTGLAIMAALVVFLAPVAPRGVTGISAILLAGYGGLLAGAVLLGIVLVFSYSTEGWRGAITFLVIVALVAPPALWETTGGSNQTRLLSEILVIRRFVAGLTCLIFFGMGIYLARQALTDDARFALVRAAVIGLLSRGGTRFRQANLTDADFGAATMVFADLRGATLVRTNWQGAHQIDRARVDETYLAQPRVRQLAITKRGVGENYDQLNLEGLNLRDGDLTRASFVGANLSQATLQRANVTEAKLAYTQLYDTDLREACLTGAFIEQWGISTKTQFDGVRCDYVYMHLPVEGNLDPLRKPDNLAESFQSGDFTDFIAPFIRTLEYYHQQHTDPRMVTQSAKTLDLVQREAINPAISALAVQQLAQRHPEADLEVVALKAKDGEKVQIRTLVSDKAQRATMSEEFRAIYAAMMALPPVDRERLLHNIVYKDEQIRELEAMLLAALNNRSFYLETRIKPRGTVKCLICTANPVQTAQLRLDVEFRDITAKLRAAEYRDVFHLIPVFAVRPADLLQSLNQHRPKIVQFSGHGVQTGELLFLDDQDYAKPVTPQALRALFRALKDDIRLVILNACYSEPQAQAIAEVIDCVVGMSDAITDEAGIVFIAAFYRALGFGRSIQNAFDQGQAALAMEGQAEDEIPRLLTRPGVDPAQIILVAPDPLVATVHTGK